MAAIMQNMANQHEKPSSRGKKDFGIQLIMMGRLKAPAVLTIVIKRSICSVFLADTLALRPWPLLPLEVWILLTYGLENPRNSQNARLGQSAMLADTLILFPFT